MNGDNLKQKRIQLQLTQAELASAVGKSRKTINLYENGAKIPEDTQMLLKMYFDKVTKGNIERESGTTTDNSMESLLAKRVLEELKPFIEKSLVSRQELIKLVQATALKVAENNIKMQEMEVVLKEMDKKISLLLSE